MAGDQETPPSRLYADLDARVAASEAHIAALQQQATQARERVSEGEARATEDRDRIGALEGRADADAILIAELQADGLVSRDQSKNLTLALRTSRTIGAAVGIVMARHDVAEEEAFQMLRKASMNTNQRLRALADDVVRTGDLTPDSL